MKISESLEASAFSNYVRVSPMKVRRILDQVRGRSFSEAVLILKFLPHKSSLLILKVLCSAASNAKQRFSINESSLFIKEAKVNTGPILKRFQPHAQGRGFPIKKYLSHIIIAF